LRYWLPLEISPNGKSGINDDGENFTQKSLLALQESLTGAGMA
jgi:hypothetical protein